MTTLMLSKTPVRNRQTSDSANDRDRPKPIVARPKPATHQQQDAAGTLPRLEARRDQRHRQRAEPGRGAQPAEPGGADLQDVLREDRQQRDRAAEQHREQIERDRRQEQRVGADEPEAREHVARAAALPRPAAARGPACVRSITMKTSCPTAASANASVAAAGGGDQHAADRRAGDRGELERRRQPRVGVGELRRRQQLRQDGVDRRRRKRARGADHERAASRSPTSGRSSHDSSASPVAAQRQDACARRCRCCGADTDRRRCRRRPSATAPAPARRRRPGRAPTDRRCARRAASRPRR